MAFMPSVVLFSTYCVSAWRLSNPRMTGGSAAVLEHDDQSQREFKVRTRAVLRLRARITFINIAIGWAFICLGLSPTCTMRFGGRDAYAPIYGNTNMTVFGMVACPGFILILLGIYPNDTNAVRLLSLLLPILTAALVFIEGASNVIRIVPKIGEYKHGAYAASLAELTLACTISLWGTPIVLILTRLAYRRRTISAAALLAQLWMWTTTALILSGVQTVIYASCRYFLNIRHWYNDDAVRVDLMLGICMLLSGGLMHSNKRRACLLSICALRCRPTYHDRNAAADAGLSLYGRRQRANTGPSQCSSHTSATSSPCTMYSGSTEGDTATVAVLDAPHPADVQAG